MPTTHRSRTVLRLSGEGVRDWLGNLLTNVIAGPVTYGALLTPQGKIIADMFVTDRGNHLLLDTPVHMGAALLKRLKMYRLRAPIEIEDVSETEFLHVTWGDAASRGDSDPRRDQLGTRLFLDHIETGDGNFDRHRLSLGVPDSEWDFETTSVFPMDANMDLLNGVNYSKGCFVGQEVVSRMKRKSVVRKRMQTLRLNGDANDGDRVMAGEKKVGAILHVNDDLAMALLRVDHLADFEGTLSVGDHITDVLKLPLD